MELPEFNQQQSGAVYYFSPMTVNNLGMVDNAHKYPPSRTVSGYMHCHVYTDAIRRKCVNKMASVIVKTLRHLNLLPNNEHSSELNILFDNCCSQNKNNTVLRLAAWITQLGYIMEVNFIFLVVGHTKSAAARLFNSLKIEYWTKN